MSDSSEGVVSLQEAADILGVHYMTAYRYMRQGQLQARKEGGVWKVAVADLEQFRNGAQREPQATGAGSGRRSAPWSDRLEARLLAGDMNGAWSIVETCIDGGAEVDEVYLDVISPAMQSIGHRWNAGEIDIFLEHRATGITSRIVARLGARCTRRGRSRGTVVVGGPRGETHALPISMLSDIVRLAGFEVCDLGANTPTESFIAAAVESDAVVAVGVSVTYRESLDAAAETVAALHNTLGDAVPVFVGGFAITSDEDAMAVGADGWAADARAFVEQLNTQLKRKGKGSAAQGKSAG